MKYTQRHLELNAQFKVGMDTHLEKSDIDIRYFSFRSIPQLNETEASISSSNDNQIEENNSFVYPVFMPRKTKKADKAILLLHGLNERNWSKYLTWAEYLCQKTGKPILLFPIAFHINRSPESWSNPRDLRNLLELRRQKNGEDRSLSFANATFSERISDIPYRLYSSGRQSVNDLSQLFLEIKQGLHTAFLKNTQIDILAYSIGAFLAEITLMTNSLGLFSNSKLFLFCGGGIFSSMKGENRSIMDKMAYEKLFNYYLTDFSTDKKENTIVDKIYNSFNCMISPERNRIERESFFDRLGNQIKGISLEHDKVMPYHGVVEALGAYCANNRIAVHNFSFNYTHENPFPIGTLTDPREVNTSFTKTFNEIADFLG